MRSKKGKELDFNIMVIDMLEDFDKVGKIICLRERLIHIVEKEVDNRIYNLTGEHYKEE